MTFLLSLYIKLQFAVRSLLCPLAGLPSLGLRLYLAPIFFEAGSHKLNGDAEHWWQRLTVQDGVVSWFGDGLGLPMPTLLAHLAAYTEFFGAFLLLFGFATRWISIPLMITMLVAMFTVHWSQGWLAIAQGDGFYATPQTQAAIERLDAAKAILQEHGNYDWLTEYGNFVVLNNGIEFAATYLLMLMALCALGGGRYVSADYWLARRLAPQLLEPKNRS